MHSNRSIDVVRRFRIRPLSAYLAAIVACSAVASEPEHSGSAFFVDIANAFYPLRPSSPTPDFVAAIQRSRGPSEPARREGQPSIRSVMNCDDPGAGSLREAITNAASGDTISLTALACSEITLSTGAIHVSVTDLTLQGPGAGQLSIKGGASANHLNRIFNHTGVGTLSILDLTLADAHYQGPLAKGGCIYTAGSIDFQNSIASGCFVEAPSNTNAYAIGGAFYARENVTLTNAVVTGSIARSAENQAFGGGVFVRGNFTATNTTIANSLAIAQQAYSGGGGIALIGGGDFELVGSTVFGNAARIEGGIYVNTTGASTIKNSTISDNYASQTVGGAGFGSALTISNSTVTKNLAGFADYGVGLYVAQALTAQSSIISNNLGDGGAVELDVFAGSVSGGENVISVANVAVPAETVIACPFLSPLQDNGGPTLTHRLMKGSPGIDVGNNLAGLTTDQRSTGFERDFGMHTDIGAVEWRGEADDSIFKTAFEALCD